jgi:RsiW-degrading membrane proteinase PrsW (M82 family)
MTKAKSNTIADASWDIPFWFAVFSPVLGMLVGFLGLLLLYH